MKRKPINNQNPCIIGGAVGFLIALALTLPSSVITIEAQALGGGNGAGTAIPLKLGDFIITFPGSCKGYLDGHFISCTCTRESAIDRMVGLSEGSFWRHLRIMLATVRAAFGGKRPFILGSIMRERRQSSDKYGLLHLMRFRSSFGYRGSRFRRPVINSRSTIP